MARGDGREWDRGDIRPYRPIPSDFRAVYLQMGWSKELREHYRTNDRCLRRWIEECGEELREARAKASGCFTRPHQRSKRYVMGRTLTAVKLRPVIKQEDA